MNVLFAALVLLFVFAALVCFLLARRESKRTGLPVGARIVYADTGAWQRVEKPLFSERYRLTGKPDYLVEENRALVPVEVKPNRGAPAPLESDVMQLAAYGLLVEENFPAKRSDYGLLKYREAVFRIELTRELRAVVIELLNEMRSDFFAHDVSRSHTEPRKCRACGYRDACGQALETQSL